MKPQNGCLLVYFRIIMLQNKDSKGKIHFRLEISVESSFKLPIRTKTQQI